MGKSKVEVTLEEKDGEYMISVADQGIGIPTKAQDRIFEKFFRADNAREREAEGSGIGLYITKMIVEASGGKLWFKSPSAFRQTNGQKEGYGTTFFLSIPKIGMLAHGGEKELTTA